MTITMTSKNQITIPKTITDALGLQKGSLFDIHIHRNKIEIVPLEVTEKVFTEEQYQKLDKLSKAQKSSEKKVTKAFISQLKSGNIT